VNCLAAVVDEVPVWEKRTGQLVSAEGVSVARGWMGGRWLGGLWDDMTGEDIQGEAGQEPPHLEVHIPRVEYTGHVKVKLPLANTIFTTGTEYTLFASRWSASQPGEIPTLLERTVPGQKRKQEIVFTERMLQYREDSVSTLLAPLVPLTPAREVVSALGNILKEVQVDGQAVPASKELEEVIPALLEHRRKEREKQGWTSDEGELTGMDVWALVIPKRYVEAGLPMLEQIDFRERYVPREEGDLAGKTADQMARLVSCGAQLRRVGKSLPYSRFYSHLFDYSPFHSTRE